MFRKSRSRTVMAKKCTKKCDARAEWFSLSNLLLFLLYVRDVNFLAAWVAKLPLLISNTVISW